MSWLDWAILAVLGGNLLFFGGLYLWMVLDEWLGKKRDRK